ncbi:hypothetical protein PO124_10570 [Bacillus licheniformis]|nr:hypothetical protein [Bacillus licheniformis]
MAKLHEQEQTLYGRLKETESEVSRLRGQTKGVSSLCVKRKQGLRKRRTSGRKSRRHTVRKGL